jgi:uncharacterized phage protein gp47/JayE
MPLSLSDLQTPLTRTSVRTVLEQLLTCLSFPVTAWQDESNARAFVEICAALGAELSNPIALLAKMKHLDTAEGEFLDAALQSDYDETRQLAIASSFPVRLVNSGAVTYSPPATNQIILRSSTGRTFSATSGPTLTAGTTTTVAFSAEVAGSAGNVQAQTLELVTPFAGVTAVFDGLFTTAGSDAESDPAARERAKSKWATLRTEKISAGILNLVRTAAPALHGISIDQDNPRGPGTLDVYLAADTATAGVSDVAAVQTALSGALFGTGTVVQAGLAIAAPTVLFDVAATIYTKGVNESDTFTLLIAAWRDFLLTVPVGGFDLSPGPSHTLLNSQISTALSQVPGVVSVSITGPSADTTVATHTKVLEGAIAFSIIPITEG